MERYYEHCHNCPLNSMLYYNTTIWNSQFSIDSALSTVEDGVEGECIEDMSVDSLAVLTDSTLPRSLPSTFGLDDAIGFELDLCTFDFLGRLLFLVTDC